MKKTHLSLLILLLISCMIFSVMIVHNKGIITLTSWASVGNATARVNLTEEISITVTGSIDWEDGRVNADALNATLDSNNGTVTGGSWNPIESYIKIKNDGTVNISVNVSADGNNNAAGLIGGTSPLFQIKGNETESDACAGTLVQSFTDIPNSTEAPLGMCDLLKYGPQDEDEFNVSIRIVIPSDAVSGVKETTLTFKAAKA